MFNSKWGNRFVTLCLSCIVIGLFYTVYGLAYYTPALPHQTRTAPVSCPVTRAVTTISREDDGIENTNRTVEVHCDYKAAGAPEKKEGDEGYFAGVYHAFDGDANQNPAIVKGTIFNCTASWKVPTAPYVHKIFKGTLTPRDAGLKIENCVIAQK